MAVDYNKYQKLVLKYSYNGVSWTNVKPEQYKKGEVIEANSYDCGYVDPIYRMVQLPETDYMCINQSKYYKLRQQVSYDDGATWEDVVPYVEEPGNVLEENSYDCDYGVTWLPVDDEYYCQMAIVPTNYCDATSNCPSDMYFMSQTIVETFSLPDKTSDYARYFSHPRAIFRSDGYLISCDNNGKILYNGWIQNRLAIDSTYLAKSIYSSYEHYQVIDIVNDEMYIWFFCNRTRNYYWNISKINIKTGLFTILNDSGTPSSTKPWQTTNNEKNIMSDRNYIYTDGTKLYKVTRYHYTGYTSTATLLKTWDFSGNNYSQTDVFRDAVPNSDKLTHAMSNPGVFYLWEYFNDTSVSSGVIYRYDVSTDSAFTEYGIWFCDDSKLNECPLPSEGNYTYSRATNVSDVEVNFENYQVETTDTALMRINRLRGGGIVNKSYYFYNGGNSYPYALLVSGTYELANFSDGTVSFIKNNAYKTAE